MKKNVFIFIITAFCSGCNEDVKINESKLNEAGEKLQKTVQKGTDSIGAKLKRLKNKIDTTNTSTLRQSIIWVIAFCLSLGFTGDPYKSLGL